ncbi:hypothetical protein Bca52824_083847 [Brassica carinata]|uniref:Cystatin domain-containing protein n=1 Tax=Brassica carinata TaxID=52824 RepID=A0A8X7TU84_BRACI|nr:hypothetical protein Bca52824_083847 [Brassica carinata]
MHKYDEVDDLSLSLVLLPLITVVEGGWSLNPPGKFPVNPLDPKIVEIAKFAVSEHNKESKANLVYEKVVRARNLGLDVASA